MGWFVYARPGRGKFLGPNPVIVAVPVPREHH